ncbi:PGPGW domain-containing protein [Solicola sp. PLA-1-18]|uniref:PGPGW domain-containing protein n=1 Tax=Solicola sp. PLA-1-18 TaxID=3380532 RepID=UPI003B77EA7F
MHRVTSLPHLLLGWVVTLAGVALVPLPGPGTVVLVLGVGLLSSHYAWAERALAPLRDRARAAVAFGVATRSRIAVSLTGVLVVVALGVLWWVDPAIPAGRLLGVPVGDHLPFGGTWTAVGLWASAVTSGALVVGSALAARPSTSRACRGCTA